MFHLLLARLLQSPLALTRSVAPPCTLYVLLPFMMIDCDHDLDYLSGLSCCPVSHTHSLSSWEVKGGLGGRKPLSPTRNTYVPRYPRYLRLSMLRSHHHQTAVVPRTATTEPLLLQASRIARRSFIRPVQPSQQTLSSMEHESTRLEPASLSLFALFFLPGTIGKKTADLLPILGLEPIRAHRWLQTTAQLDEVGVSTSPEFHLRLE